MADPIRHCGVGFLPGILTSMVDPVVQDLVALSLKLGDPSADLAILAEGNVSARAGVGLFYVKASGFSMSSITSDGFTLVRSAPILRALEGPDLSDEEVRALLAESRAEPERDPLPSVETFMHAYLLSLPDVSSRGAHPSRPLL